jgi:hypothetical protein
MEDKHMTFDIQKVERYPPDPNSQGVRSFRTRMLAKIRRDVLIDNWKAVWPKIKTFSTLVLSNISLFQNGATHDPYRYSA